MIGGFINVLASAADPNVGVVAGLGMGTVFAGLIVMVVLLSILNTIFSKMTAKAPSETKTDVSAAPVAGTNEKMDDETVAAVSAAIAETMGRDVSGIRITSIKKVN